MKYYVFYFGELLGVALVCLVSEHTSAYKNVTM